MLLENIYISANRQSNKIKSLQSSFYCYRVQKGRLGGLPLVLRKPAGPENEQGVTHVWQHQSYCPSHDSTLPLER